VSCRARTALTFANSYPAHLSARCQRSNKRPALDRARRRPVLVTRGLVHERFASKGYSVEPHRLKDTDNAPRDLIPALQNFLTVAIFPNGSACHGTIDGCACCVE
jgi:hypothetical protein